VSPETSDDQDARSGGTRHPAITAASLLFVVLGASWLLTYGYVLLYVASNRDLPIIFGFRPGAGRIYDVFGRDGAIVGLGLFAAVWALSILAGFWLWKSRRKGAILGAITIALGPIFWYGFGLPIPPLIAALQLGLIAAGWRSLG